MVCLQNETVHLYTIHIGSYCVLLSLYEWFLITVNARYFAERWLYFPPAFSYCNLYILVCCDRALCDCITRKGKIYKNELSTTHVK